MKERPIVYSPPMVLARLAGKKGNTRRLMDPQPDFRADWIKCDLNDVWRAGTAAGEVPQFGVWKCPLGVPGDLLWVRENYWVNTWKLDGTGRAVLFGFYRADRTMFQVVLDERETVLYLARARRKGSMSSRFMYRSLSRGVDEIVSIRAERVQDISEKDAKAEGVEKAFWFEPAGKPPGEHYHVDGVLTRNRKTYRNAFATLWEALHGPGAWERNDWVWRYELRRIQ